MMKSPTTYSALVLPPYRSLLLRDPTADAPDEDNGRALRLAIDRTVAANTYRAYIHTAQEAARVSVAVEVHQDEGYANSSEGWEGERTVDIYCPTGRLIIELISAGAVDLDPGPVESIELGSGEGVYRLRVLFRGREETAKRISNPGGWAGESLRQLDGNERYVVQVWPMTTEAARD